LVQEDLHEGGLDLDALVPEHGGRIGGRLADVLVLQLGIIGPKLLTRAVLADASRTRRTVRRSPRMHGWPFILPGSIVIRSNT
jgi:hypothetical protein